jgi:hypothetical protein
MYKYLLNNQMYVEIHEKYLQLDSQEPSPFPPSGRWYKKLYLQVICTGFYCDVKYLTSVETHRIVSSCELDMYHNSTQEQKVDKNLTSSNRNLCSES